MCVQLVVRVVFRVMFHILKFGKQLCTFSLFSYWYVVFILQKRLADLEQVFFVL